jgi:hypothetical protein
MSSEEVSKTDSEIDRVFMIEDDPDFGDVIGVTYQHSDGTRRTEWFPMDNISKTESNFDEHEVRVAPEDIEINPMLEDRTDPEKGE